MSTRSRLTFTILLVLSASAVHAQKTFRGKIIDSITKEPLQGASIRCSDEDCQRSCVSLASGDFEFTCLDCHSLQISFIGYERQSVNIDSTEKTVQLVPSTLNLNAVVVTASRGERIKRSEAPVAIASISSQTLMEAKATSFDQVLNKISGVNMVNLGNEQHQMSIRQPMTTKSLFLYLEDGIPVRTTGLFNHNALLEINMASVKSIEVIKGPSSSLYGSEAIGGVVNFTTFSPTAMPVLKLSTQANNNGYGRADLQAGFSKDKWGFALSGYYARKKNGFLEYSDYHKGTFTARVDYRFTNRTSLSNSLTWLSYYSDMPGGVDSAMFETRKLVNPHTFTFREVDGVRARSTLRQQWNGSSKTTVSVIYRNNSIAQNPAYRVKDDYRKTGNTWVGRKDLAHGEINKSRFDSYGLIAQHREKLPWKKAALTAGISMDISPSSYDARYISIRKDTIEKKYTSYSSTDSLLTDYRTGISNYAAFAGLEFNPAAKLKLVFSIRYDHFVYKFDNRLQPSAFSGSTDTTAKFSRLSPKIGFTYNLSPAAGFYANYSQGFVPPQVTEMFTGVKVPELDASVFYNYEAGGWISMLGGRLSADFSLYQLDGTNEVVSVKLDDGSYENRNAGKTSHRGMEMGIKAKLHRDLTLRVSGAYSRHRFLEFSEKGQTYDGNEMNNAPRWMHNAEIWYRPSCLKGLRVGVEWQKIGAYFMDAKNTLKYKGYDLLNLRTAFKSGPLEIWLNVNNAADSYFSYISTKSSHGHSYQLAEPRSFTVGISYDFGQLMQNQ